MKLSINREALLCNLNVVANGLPTKTPLQALNGIKISAVEGGVLLTTSKSDISIRTLVMDETLNVEESGEALVGGKIFLDVIRKIGSKDIKLETEGNLLKINGGRSHYKLTTMDVNEYPDIEFVESENTFTMGASVLTNLIKTTVFSAAHTEKKPILTGVNFSYNNGEFKAVATDSFRLSLNKYDITLGDIPTITIPSKALTDLIKRLGDYDGDLSLTLLDNRMLVKFDNIDFQTRLLDGAYPDTSRLIASEFPIELRFNREDLINVVDRVSIMIPSDTKDKEITYSVIMLKVSPQGVVLSSTNQVIGDAKEEITPINELKETDNIVLGFSAKYFLDALRSFKGNEVALHLTSNVRPFTLTEDNSNLIQLILPVRLS